MTDPGDLKEILCDPILWRIPSRCVYSENVSEEHDSLRLSPPRCRGPPSRLHPPRRARGCVKTNVSFYRPAPKTEMLKISPAQRRRPDNAHGSVTNTKHKL
ncbi:hypothetical protein EVAR_79520_1 [Eumeta japonica]|uniref:Uncharacterized protein n=1 Tax=Eumeta variegata TaxID=151549 RepID=A0A4C1UE47_EUMVA|nr:hypothetical protein EVAR_79520_1 [Eumeta japonica]